LGVNSAPDAGFSERGGYFILSPKRGKEPTDGYLQKEHRMSVPLGDATLKFLADTDGLDKTVNELLDRIQRTIEAARAAWNTGKKETKDAA
jgi:hypothetical protein